MFKLRLDTAMNRVDFVYWLMCMILWFTDESAALFPQEYILLLTCI